MVNNVNDEWEMFLNGDFNSMNETNDGPLRETNELNNDIPECSPIYISTKTKIAFLNTPIVLNDIFWKIKIMDYYDTSEGIVKKQMKFNSTTKEEVETIVNNLEKEKYYNCKILTQIDNPNGRITFKDIRKINVGISKKDLLYNKTKQKSAFYNCFVLIFRLIIDNNYKEIHVKVFNTGKLEIPGIQTNEMFDITIKKLIETLQPFYNKPIYYYKDKLETVLVNSNFSCGFYINREKLHNILKYEYKINSNFDPCSYPGIQCKYNIENQKISFMIFRTGSVLIVGKCEDDILYKIYEFLKTLFKKEYNNIFCNSTPSIKKTNKIKKRKIIYINES
jgi:TATA-box binding protein (TBP) (component of TFIID and TFIIIB)